MKLLGVLIAIASMMTVALPVVGANAPTADLPVAEAEPCQFTPVAAACADVYQWGPYTIAQAIVVVWPTNSYAVGGAYTAGAGGMDYEYAVVLTPAGYAYAVHYRDPSWGIHFAYACTSATGCVFQPLP